MIPNKYQNDFFAGIRGDKVKYCINDCVEVISGKFEGIGCAVISIEQIDPEVILLVESGVTGESIKIKQSELKSLEL